MCQKSQRRRHKAGPSSQRSNSPLEQSQGTEEQSGNGQGQTLRPHGSWEDLRRIDIRCRVDGARKKGDVHEEEEDGGTGRSSVAVFLKLRERDHFADQAEHTARESDNLGICISFPV